jgi:ubiquinone/menaquinone biosynthesis C-methylase UbiE
MDNKDAQFSGSIPAAYDRYLGPVFFQAYAEDIAARLKLDANASVLEVACGTGILTRVLRDVLPAGTRLVASDLNDAMIQIAGEKFQKDEAVEWRQADACDLPFDDRSFDAVVCQFGFMFVPDKALAARETHRVLKPGGVFLFNVWDSLEHNDLGRIAHETIASFFENDPPAFYQVPFGYHDHAEIKCVLEGAGFQEVRLEVVTKTSGSAPAGAVAEGLVRGSPVALAIAERDPSLLGVISNAVAAALRRHCAGDTVSVPMRAIVVEAQR